MDAQAAATITSTCKGCGEHTTRHEGKRGKRGFNFQSSERVPRQSEVVAVEVASLLTLPVR